MIAADGPGPDDDADSAELETRIAAAAEHLPDDQREVFWMRMQSGLPFREIARIQGCSINTALARMQYALNKMRVELDEVYREYGGAA